MSLRYSHISMRCYDSKFNYSSSNLLIESRIPTWIIIECRKLLRLCFANFETPIYHMKSWMQADVQMPEPLPQSQHASRPRPRRRSPCYRLVNPNRLSAYHDHPVCVTDHTIHADTEHRVESSTGRLRSLRCGCGNFVSTLFSLPNARTNLVSTLVSEQMLWFQSIQL